MADNIGDRYAVLVPAGRLLKIRDTYRLAPTTVTLAPVEVLYVLSSVDAEPIPRCPDCGMPLTLHHDPNCELPECHRCKKAEEELTTSLVNELFSLLLQRVEIQPLVQELARRYQVLVQLRE